MSLLWNDVYSSQSHGEVLQQLPQKAGIHRSPEQVTVRVLPVPVRSAIYRRLVSDGLPQLVIGLG
jgi:hypothetical protein